MQMKRTFWKTGLATMIACLAMIALGAGPQTWAVAAAPSAPSTAGPGEDQPAAAVKIDNFTFSPNPLTIEKGTTVRWTNHDDVTHTVVADDKSFKSKALDTDDAFTYTFTKPGTYSYFCSLHPKMVAKVVVK